MDDHDDSDDNSIARSTKKNVAAKVDEEENGTRGESVKKWNFSSLSLSLSLYRVDKTKIDNIIFSLFCDLFYKVDNLGHVTFVDVTFDEDSPFFSSPSFSSTLTVASPLPSFPPLMVIIDPLPSLSSPPW